MGAIKKLQLQLKNLDLLLAELNEKLERLKDTEESERISEDIANAEDLQSLYRAELAELEGEEG